MTAVVELEPASSATTSDAALDRVRGPLFIDGFAGCGGLSLGLKRAGFSGLFAIEKDAFAFETLEANFSGSPQLDYHWPALIERRAWEIGELVEKHSSYLRGLSGQIDLVAGGPPCQGFSHAGRRRADDPRNNLFEAYLQLVDLVRPRLVLIENVRGFESDFPNAAKGEIKNFAAELKERLSPSYECFSKVIKASEYGVPQSRPRFFLIGVRRGDTAVRYLRSFFEHLASNKSGFLSARYLSATTTSRDAIGDLELSIAGTKACPDSPGFSAIARPSAKTAFQKAMRDGFDGDPSDTRLARHRPEIEKRFAAIIKSCREDGRLNVSISKELRAEHGLKKMAIRVMDPLTPAPTITSLPDDLLHYSEPRTLTVRENARLQTFPDWFVFKGKYTTGGERRRLEIPRFTQVANAVPPLLAEQVGAVLIEALKH